MVQPFHLRRFSLHHHRSTMKVGTDSIILGAWVGVSNEKNILDVGCGCGILSLLMAQRTKAIIDGVELDKASAEEADSISKPRNGAKDLRFLIWILLISLPLLQKIWSDYFKSALFHFPVQNCWAQKKFGKAHRHARFRNLDKYKHQIAYRFRQAGCGFAFAESRQFIDIAAKHGLILQRMLQIVSVKGRKANRINMKFGFNEPKSIHIEEFAIRKTDGKFTKEYHELLNEYYLGLWPVLKTRLNPK